MPEYKHLETKVSHLLIAQPDKEFSRVSVFISEPTPLEEKNLGKIFIISEIEIGETIYQELLELINDEFSHYYYRSEDLDINHAFESALQKLNQKLQETSAEIGSTWLNKFNVSIAVLKDQSLLFTQLGSIHAFLIQRQQIINIIDTTKNKSQTINPLKIFNNVLSGKLTAQSTVVFCTESLLDYFSPEKIKKTILEYSAEESSVEIEKILTENNVPANFAALIINLVAESAPSAQTTVTTSLGLGSAAPINDSMHALVNKEKTTSQFLSPTVWTTVKNQLEHWRSNTTAEATPSLGAVDPTWKLMLKKIWQGLKIFFWKVVSGIIWCAKMLGNLFKKRGEYRNKFQHVPNNATNKITHLVAWFKQLSLPRKILLGLVILAIFIFAQSIIYKGKAQESEALKQKYAEQLTLGENALNEAKADLLMNNEKGAREKLETAKTALANIPADSTSAKEQRAALEKNLQEQIQKINRIQNIATPQILLDYNTLNSNLSLKNFALIADNFYAFDNNNGSVYQGNQKNGEVKTVLSASDKAPFTAIIKDSAATILGVRENNNFFQFNPVLEKYSAVELTLEKTDAAIPAFVSYGPRLYVLDTKNNQIYKLTKDGDAYNNSTAWITENDVNLSTAKDLAIDGNIYVLKDNQVLKFYGGKLAADFKLVDFEPALTSPTALYTDENTQNIYLLEPSQKRLIVFDKAGNLVKQYTAESFTNLKDMIIDEINNKAYLLNGTQVVQVDL